MAGPTGSQYKAFVSEVAALRSAGALEANKVRAAAMEKQRTDLEALAVKLRAQAQAIGRKYGTNDIPDFKVEKSTANGEYRIYTTYAAGVGSRSL